MKYPASPLNLQTHGVPSPFLRTACRLLLRSFATISHPNALFSIGCSLFSENTRVGGTFSPPSALPTFRPSSFQACRGNFALVCFQYLTNPSQSLIDAKTIYSHTLTNPFSRNPFVFSSIQNPGVSLPTNQVQRVILEAIR